jgi:predicted transcriptional regulator of viral defense system
VSAAVAPRELVDHLLAHGRSWLTLEEAAVELGSTKPKAAASLARLRRQGRIFSPHPGLYFPIPPQYRTWGVIPALDFIDPMMRAMDRRYYVALLSAAELHGAAHQRPQVFQVVVDRPVQNRDVGRVRLRFYTRQRFADVPTQMRNSATGRVVVSTPAATCLDLTSRPNDAGGLSNVATVLAELVEEQRLTGEQLVDAAAGYPSSSIRRLGWLLEFIDADVGTDELAQTIAARDPNPRSLTLLDPRGAKQGVLDARWGLTVNQVVEPDL